MEVIFHIFRGNYLAEIIKYSDIGFLWRKVTLSSDKERKDPFIINIDGRLINSLGKRLFIEIFRGRILDVVLNPCLRQTKVTEAFIKELTNHPEKIQSLIKQIISEEKQIQRKLKFMSKLSFLILNEATTPMLTICD